MTNVDELLRATRANPVDPADEAAVAEAVEAWHGSGSPLTLHEFLGWTWEVYSDYVEHRAFLVDDGSVSARLNAMLSPRESADAMRVVSGDRELLALRAFKDRIAILLGYAPVHVVMASPDSLLAGLVQLTSRPATASVKSEHVMDDDLTPAIRAWAEYRSANV